MSPLIHDVTMTSGEESPAIAFSTEIASSTASSIYVKWAVSDDTLFPDVIMSPNVVLGYRVHYQKVASSYVQYSHFLPPSVSSYSINNLVADTYYKVCVVMYRNDTSSPDRNCMDASTTSWHIPVSIGSSIGALLALSIIVLIVLLSRCPSIARRPRASASESSKYDSMTSSRYHDEHSDTTTQCHDQDDDVFSDSCCDNHPLDAGRHFHPHHHHHPHPYPLPGQHPTPPPPPAAAAAAAGGGVAHPAFPDRVCNGSKNHAFQGVGGAAGVSSPRHPGHHHHHHSHHHHHHHHGHRTHSLGACGRSDSLERRTHSLERPRPHHSRRSRLMQLHSAHHSIQSEPAAPAPTTMATTPTPRPLHVSISDLPPAVHISDPDAPVCSLVAGSSGPCLGAGAVGGARAKTSLKDTPRTFHMSIDYDV